jgi:hypothetical protein
MPVAWTNMHDATLNMSSTESIVLKLMTGWSIMKHVVLEGINAFKARKIGIIFERNPTSGIPRLHLRV